MDGGSPTEGSGRDPGLERHGLTAAEELGRIHHAREIALRAARATIQASGRSIRATHRLQPEEARELAELAGQSLREAQGALADFPVIASAGFLHDAEKEYAEAMLCSALVEGRDVEGHRSIGVAPAAWLNGLAEAASELRRQTLDTLRRGDLERAETLLGLMDQVYDVLVSIDYPDAVTGGLRRTTDALRAVLERTRSDLTTTAIQSALKMAIDANLGER